MMTRPPLGDMFGCGMLPPMGPPPPSAALGPTPRLEMTSRPLMCPPVSAPAPTFFFSQSDLDLVLYGHAPVPTPPGVSPHALSCLRLGDLSGVEKLHSGGSHVTTALSLQSWRTCRSEPPLHDLPPGLFLAHTNVGGVSHTGIFCRKEVIPKGTRFGPFKGKVVNTSEIKTFDDNSFMWEIFKDGVLSHFVDGRGSSGNWMAYVNCARHQREQTLTVLQEGEDILYEVSRDLQPGEELLVWYGDDYLQFMGIPITLRGASQAASNSKADSENSEGFQCERCGKVFAYRYYRDKHLKYTKCVDQGDRKFPCHLCARSFEKRDRLRIHVLHVHEKHRPHKCSVCGKSFSQSSSLNKHMRVHSGERPYKCVYCSKSFTASSILRTHIRQHSGERPFKCKFCGKAFASHAAHDSHVRRTHSRDRPYSCRVCGLEFSHQFDVKLHLQTHMEGGKWKSSEVTATPVSKS